MKYITTSELMVLPRQELEALLQSFIADMALTVVGSAEHGIALGTIANIRAALAAHAFRAVRGLVP